MTTAYKYESLLRSKSKHITESKKEALKVSEERQIIQRKQDIPN